MSYSTLGGHNTLSVAFGVSIGGVEEAEKNRWNELKVKVFFDFSPGTKPSPKQIGNQVRYFFIKD